MANKTVSEKPSVAAMRKINRRMEARVFKSPSAAWIAEYLAVVI
ncbi:MAG: hypothetical protein U0Z26_06580 [Anaerolineales bacterium]